MNKKKHKRKVSRVVIFTTDAVDAKMRQLKIRPWVGNLLMILFCILLGISVGYAVYKGKPIPVKDELEVQNLDNASQLQEENNSLLLEVEILMDKVAVLSETVNQKAEEASRLETELAELSIPTGFPLTGSASIEEITEGEPICIFTAEQDILVVATASGTVSTIEDDADYGHKITVDHGNGYKTIYKNKGDVKVKVGDSVVKGTALYIIGENNTRLGYQMMREEAYINPMEVLSISG